MIRASTVEAVTSVRVFGSRSMITWVTPWLYL